MIARHGHPLLYLPRRVGLAVDALRLYPAQRVQARIARAVVRAALAAGCARLLPSTLLRLHSGAPLTRFLASQGGEVTFPEVAILAGNPNTAGRRFVLLVFDNEERPRAVVKTGTTPEAAQLLEREAGVLRQLPPTALGAPRIRSSELSDRLHALALDYVPGSTPPEGGSPQLARVLTSWLDRERTVEAGRLKDWRRLRDGCREHPVLQAIAPRVEAASLHPAVHHGDFVPWNIKVAADGAWTVLDWERGELEGLPCWDWFHYHIQPGLLVRRTPPGRHAQEIERWLAGDLFRGYAKQAGAEAICRELLLAYLLYCVNITKPSEGLDAARNLLEALTRQWNAA